MKSLLVLAATLISFSAFSAVELYYKLDNIECLVTETKVHKTITLLKGDVTTTVTSDFKSTGLEAVATKAFEQSSGTAYSANFVQVLTLNGQSIILNSKDSKESMVLIAIMGNACK